MPIIKLPDIMTDFKKYFQFLPYKKQIHEINFMIEDFNNFNQESDKFNILNELNTLKTEIMSNRKDYIYHIN